MMNETTPTIEENPLTCFFRQPKLHITIPSKGKYYADGTIELSAMGELPVYPMTAKDELVLKTPDALINGQAIVSLINSCVPAIKEPWAMPGIDLDTVLIAIKIASYGETSEFSSVCPNCSESNKYNLNLQMMIDNYADKTFKDNIKVDKLHIFIKPLDYKSISKLALRNFEEYKLINVVNDTNMSDEEKMQNYNDAFLRLTEYNIDIVTECIDYVIYEDKKIQNREHITEFIAKSERNIFSAINDLINENKKEFEQEPVSIECDECKHKYDVPVTMDESFFFALNYSQ